jgi:hypothetical protein
MNDFARSMMRDGARRGERRGMRDYGVLRYEYEGHGGSMGEHHREHDDMPPHYYEDRGYYDYGREPRRYHEYDDYARRRDSRGRYMRDRGEHDLEYFSMEDVENWKHEMKNEDGSHGEHFTKEHVKQAASMAGIDIHELGEIPFCLAMNMMYSDYCKVAQKYGVDRPEFYADMAKAFLKDKDFHGEPEEKLYLYYKCIVEKE